MVSLTRIEWAGVPLLVGPHTFLPRASSLGLLRFAHDLPLWNSDHPPRILVDMCCGSGALGIALARSRPGAFHSLLLLDASPEAVISAQASLELHGLAGRAARWEAGDPVDAPEPAFIVCNPPFLPESEAADLQEWERPCVSSPEGGLSAARRCLQSIAGSPHRMVLKCLAAQLPSLAGLAGGPRLGRHVLSDAPEVAFSFWEP